MLLSRFPLVLRAMLALTLAFGLAGAGAAHRPLERPAEAAAMAAFLAAGGSLADLCHEAGTAGHEGGHVQVHCPACVLQKSLLVQAQGAAPIPARLRLVAAWTGSEPQLALRDPLILPPARGPPVFLLS